MKALVYYVPQLAHQRAPTYAMAQGLMAHGWSVDYLPDSDTCWREADLVVGWGLRVCKRKAYGLPFLMLENGYINGASGDYAADRRQHISLQWNGLGGRGYMPPAPSGDRWAALGIDLVQRPRCFRGQVLWLGQVPGDMSIAHLDYQDLEQTAIRQLCRTYGADTVVQRPHPLLDATRPPLSSELERAELAVTINSTAAVEAILAGVPTVMLDQGSVVYDASAPWSYLYGERAPLPRRQPVLYNLAYRQWTMAELESGAAWEFAQHGFTSEHATDRGTRDAGASRAAPGRH